jgi:hypothetical protein
MCAAIVSATLRRRSASANSITPLSEDSRPPLNALSLVSVPTALNVPPALLLIAPQTFPAAFDRPGIGQAAVDDAGRRVGVERPAGDVGTAIDRAGIRRRAGEVAHAAAKGGARGATAVRRQAFRVFSLLVPFPVPKLAPGSELIEISTYCKYGVGQCGRINTLARLSFRSPRVGSAVEVAPLRVPNALGIQDHDG